MDPETGFCTGCFRTISEITCWRDADDPERLDILEELKARRRAAGLTSAADSRPRRRKRRQPSSQNG
jgi:predicted Fe-S protein YdhL (DUF1289 family)